MLKKLVENATGLFGNSAGFCFDYVKEVTSSGIYVQGFFYESKDLKKKVTHMSNVVYS